MSNSGLTDASDFRAFSWSHKRMIEACRKEGLPDPTWEQRGSSFIVTIWKDMWTTARLREVGVTNRQMLAIPTLKAKHELSAAEYIELTGVTRNTATADLAALSRAGVVKRVGAGRGAAYVLQKCTINAQNAQPNVKAAKTEGNHINDPINQGDLTKEDASFKCGTMDDTMALRIVSAIEIDPRITIDKLSESLNVARRSLVRYMNVLQENNRIRRIGGKRFGRWEVIQHEE